MKNVDKWKGLRGEKLRLFFQMEFVKVKTATNHTDFQKQAFQASSAGAYIRMVPFDHAERTLGLDASIHAKKSALDAV